MFQKKNFLDTRLYVNHGFCGGGGERNHIWPVTYMYYSLMQMFIFSSMLSDVNVIKVLITLTS